MPRPTNGGVRSTLMTQTSLGKLLPSDQGTKDMKMKLASLKVPCIRNILNYNIVIVN